MIALALLVALPLSCGAVPRPGVAMPGADGIWRGASVDACRRAAIRLGRPGFRFRGYRTMAAVRASGRDDIAFLGAPERRAAGDSIRAAALGIAVSSQLLVTRRMPIAGTRPIVCFLIGSAAEDALETWLEGGHSDAVPLGFQEPDEMADGLASGKCAAMAIDAADHAAPDRIVATLATLPIDAYADARQAPAIAAALRD